ncbi:hypothetical protein BDZ90DRAFT_235052 [Jaminaea rosea]|uniref:Uncharacterized protein n=1 Tax=Jaminaea rosea TaxID=1569628 RepID=A0A316UGF0_9BASI|nr:hypothetical protein BDZ90DRAFT_235052 [Jaminaea rosea]PWN24319.1 hypothetical protein BDZ90DRAFT_235052 [Jaminaea rosea]
MDGNCHSFGAPHVRAAVVAELSGKKGARASVSSSPARVVSLLSVATVPVPSAPLPLLGASPPLVGPDPSPPLPQSLPTSSRGLGSPLLSPLRLLSLSTHSGGSTP